MKNFFEVDSFPDFIMGQDMFLQMHHAEDDNHIAEVVNMVNRNQKDFSPYLDLGHYTNIDSAKKVISQREQLAKQGLLVDYAIQLFTGKTIGCISFTNRGDGSVGVTYYIDKQFRGMGFISKSLDIAEPEMAKLGFKEIVLEINETNENSIRVANKNGYTFNETGFCMKDFIKKLSNINNQH